MDAVKWLRQEVLFKVRSKGPENGLHVHLTVMVAMIAFVDVDNESLVGNTRAVKVPLFATSCPGTLTSDLKNS